MNLLEKGKVGSPFTVHCSPLKDFMGKPLNKEQHFNLKVSKL